MTPVHYRVGGFPPEARLDWAALIPSIGPAAAAVARYDGALAAIPDTDVLLAPLATREAELSSRIEGTQATMREVLEFEAGQAPASPVRRDDIQEVLNYRAALREAERLLADLPICRRVLCEAHRALLSGARGHGKAPGEYRRIPNWIGPPGSSIEEAKFVPVGADRLEGAMSAWERYANDDAPDRLAQLAILHAEFEALHPFLDGNGRLGRMLVPLFLWRHGLIRRPAFYISAYFEANRDAYYEGLLAVSRDDDWTGWCRFFLAAIRSQAEENLSKIQRILDLYNALKIRATEWTRSPYAIRTLDGIFGRPLFRRADFAKIADIPARAARRNLDVLCENGVLDTISPAGGRRTAILIFRGLLEIVGSREEFR